MNKNEVSQECKEFWEHIDKVAAKVRHWPTWMGGEAKKTKECPHCYGCGFMEVEE